MPIIYLTCLSCILSPLTFILIKQNVNFYKYEQIPSSTSITSQDNTSTNNIKYQMSSIYIRQHEWLKAIILLDTLAMDNNSKQYNRKIAMILEKNRQDMLANKYNI
uniref:Uncharacterized protein n=1 Tax=Izziella formosana TaxID=1653389 RepID=A0A1G4NUI0_9FLOR|nr:Hypothetical protein ycf37 [Izziella formosana]SCW22297.1 Hypothetical protein ycf37 [Izziella formosana]